MKPHPSRAIPAWQSRSSLPILILTFVLTLSILSACTQTAIDFEQAPLFSLEDIQQAKRAKQLSDKLVYGTDLNNQELNIELDEESEPLLSTQAVLPNQNGMFTYYRYSGSTYQIWTYDQATQARALIYSSSQEVQSVASSLDGSLVIASLKRGDQFDIYLFDQRPGAAHSVVQLSDTDSEDEKNVSMTRDGMKLVWDSGTSFKAIHVCDFNLVAQSCNLSTLGSDRSQYEPSISGNGEFIALVRVLGSGHYRVLIYNLQANTYTTVFTRIDPLQHPSVSDDGLTVMYVWDRVTDKGQFYTKLKSLNDNSIKTPARNTVAMHSHLTADGGYFAHNLLRPSGQRIYTRNLTSGARANVLGGNWNYDGAFWQKAAAEPYTDPSLVGWWKFDETSGSVATDSSGKENHATVQDNFWSSGIIDGAFEARNNRALVTIPSSSSIRSMEHLTIMAWVNRTLDENLTLIGHNYTSTNSMFFGFHGPAFKWRLDKEYAVSGQFGRCIAGTATPNQWYHMTGTYDGSAVKLYVDGVLICSQPLSGDLNLGNEVFTMAGVIYEDGSRGGRYFGRADDVRFYNRALSQQEIVDLYNSP